jgi:predicted small integral membrane protein
MDIAWMAWTWQTGLFFLLLAATFCVMTSLAIRYPEAERYGLLRIPTTRGDRLFLSLLGAAFIHLAWIGFVGAEAIVTLHFAGGLEVSSVWIASLISLIYAAAVFRWV